MQTKMFLKSNASKKLKTHQHTARQTQQTMTKKLNIDNTYSDTVDRRPAGNRVDGSARNLAEYAPALPAGGSHTTVPFLRQDKLPGLVYGGS